MVRGARGDNLRAFAEICPDVLDRLWRHGTRTSPSLQRRRSRSSTAAPLSASARSIHPKSPLTEHHSACRMEIVVKENKIQSLQKAVNEQTALLRQYNVDFQAYEKQANRRSSVVIAGVSSVTALTLTFPFDGQNSRARWRHWSANFGYPRCVPW